MTTPSSDAFVPLTLTPAARARASDFRVLKAEHPETARPLREMGHTPASPDTNHAPRPGCEPKVTLHKEADRVIGIHIECSCGQVIDLKCGYEAG